MYSAFSQRRSSKTKKRLLLKTDFKFARIAYHRMFFMASFGLLRWTQCWPSEQQTPSKPKQQLSQFTRTANSRSDFTSNFFNLL
jgi:hypothetical protein